MQVGIQMRSSAAAVALLVLACGPAKSARPAAESAPAPAAVGQRLDIRSIAVRRTPCFGSCPTFSYEFSRGGMAHYEGGRFATDTGKRVAPFDSAAFARMANQVVAAGFFESPAEFPLRITDLPGWEIRVTVSDSVHRVDWTGGSEGVPERVKRLATSLADSGAALAWKREP
ncbi:MAG: DUF6438 domain-containing protein [Gemmatimonadota bacterium]